MTGVATGSAEARSAPPLDVAAFAAVSLVVTLGYALADRQGLFWDEYYQLLAGRSWAREGTLAVGDGVYERAAWLSISVGWLFRVFGEHVLVARSAAAVVAAAWCVLVFAWVGRSDRPTAWVAGLLLLTSPLFLVNVVMVRSYGVAGLLVTVSVALVDRLTVGRIGVPKGAILLAAALACLALAYGLTPLTALWAVGLVAWGGAVGARRVLAWRKSPGIFVAGALVLVAAITLAWTSGWLPAQFEGLRQVRGWSQERVGDVRFYERLIRSDYPLVWGLSPLIAAAALLRRLRVAGLCAVFFGLGLGMLSIAATKSERYFAPLLPFFFIVVGAGLVEIVPPLLRWVAGLGSRLLSSSRSARLRAGAGTALAVATVGVVLAATPAVTRLDEIPRGTVRSRDRPAPGTALSVREWGEAAPRLRSLMEEADVVVTPNALQLLYHVGDYDVAMRRTVISELRPPVDFMVDPRTGKPAIAELSSLQRVVSEHETGLIVGERWRWGHSFEGLTPDVVAWIEAELIEVDDVSPKLRAFRWERR